MPTLSRLDIPTALTADAPPVEWIIPDFLPRGSLIALAGMAGTGKSFLSYSLSMAAATGIQFLNRQMPVTKVLYFDQENSQPDAIQYLRWAWHGLGKPPIELLGLNFVLAPFVLGMKDWPSIAARYVIEYRPDLIVFDTTTPAFNIDDENDNSEASKAICGLRTIQSLIQPTPGILALKHAKLDSTSGRYTLRGAKAWESQVDGVVFQMKTAGRDRADGLTNTELKPSKVRAFGLRETIHIRPEWLMDEAQTKVGLRLKTRD